MFGRLAAQKGMTMLKTYPFRVAQARRISHPTHNGIEKHIFLMRCIDLPEGLTSGI
jgi:hypothetical protein